MAWRARYETGRVVWSMCDPIGEWERDQLPADGDHRSPSASPTRAANLQHYSVTRISRTSSALMSSLSGPYSRRCMARNSVCRQHDALIDGMWRKGRWTRRPSSNGGRLRDGPWRGQETGDKLTRTFQLETTWLYLTHTAAQKDRGRRRAHLVPILTAVGSGCCSVIVVVLIGEEWVMDAPRAQDAMCPGKQAATPWKPRRSQLSALFTSLDERLSEPLSFRRLTLAARWELFSDRTGRSRYMVSVSAAAISSFLVARQEL
ncbi:hypothetical protein BJ912DRAFT_935306 [Pholiota molesta]|nr:hypothetical protein BJ912DRAFT_935306 [Pholiota molesta]